MWKNFHTKIPEEQWEQEVILGLYLGVLCLVSNQKQEIDLIITGLQ